MGFRLGFDMGGIMAPGSGKGSTAAAIILSAASLPENSPAGTAIGTLSVVNATGTAVFTLTDSAGNKIQLAGTNNVNVQAGATNTDFETTPTFTFQVSVSGTTPAISPKTFTINVGDVDDTAPTITSGNAFSQPENSLWTLTLTANEAVTWSKVGGADQALFTLVGNQLSLTARDYEIPTDADTNNTYIVQVRATDGAGNQTNQTITLTVTDISEGGGYIPAMKFNDARNSMYISLGV